MEDLKEQVLSYNDMHPQKLQSISFGHNAATCFWMVNFQAEVLRAVRGHGAAARQSQTAHVTYLTLMLQECSLCHLWLGLRTPRRAVLRRHRKPSFVRPTLWYRG